MSTFELHKSLAELFEIYGYETKLNDPDKGMLVFGIRQGKYFAIEVVTTGSHSSTEVNKQIEKYAKLGYATNHIEFSTLGGIRNTLFNGTFQVEFLKERASTKYDRFREQQSRNLGFQYQYFEAPFGASSDEAHDSLIEAVCRVVFSPGPWLIVIEAAAGFGKTCTAYQLLNQIASRSKEHHPLFAELSRNRQASIFRYVLLDEIDREFPLIKSTLVQYEITNGRIPVIIDGFDELLDKSIKARSRDDNKSEFEQAESMLETISELLTGNAKIILTTRSTAILPSGEFEHWISEREDSFKSINFTLYEPDITEWIGQDKERLLREINAPIHHLSNPVLLSYFRSLNLDDFRLVCNEPEQIIENYFKFMLKREQQRQGIKLTIEEQKQIFEDLCKLMIELDFKSESKSFIKECITHNSSKTIESSREQYSASERPTLEELIDILSNHALLNRAGQNEDQVGFINDYILGYLCGDVALECDEEWITQNLSNKHFYTLICDSNTLRNSAEKELIRASLLPLDSFFDDSTKLRRDIALLSMIDGSYSDCFFSINPATNILFSEKASLQNLYFEGCRFIQCSFNFANFDNVQFINCTFEDCQFDGLDLNTDPQSVQFLSCSFYPADSNPKKTEAPLPTVESHSMNEFEVRILQNFWPQGRKNAHLSRRLETLTKGFSAQEYKDANRAVDSLRKKGYIGFDQDYARINKPMIADIKRILKR